MYSITAEEFLRTYTYTPENPSVETREYDQHAVDKDSIEDFMRDAWTAISEGHRSVPEDGQRVYAVVGDDESFEEISEIGCQFASLTIQDVSTYLVHRLLPTLNIEALHWNVKNPRFVDQDHVPEPLRVRTVVRDPLPDVDLPGIKWLTMRCNTESYVWLWSRIRLPDLEVLELEHDHRFTYHGYSVDHLPRLRVIHAPMATFLNEGRYLVDPRIERFVVRRADTLPNGQRLNTLKIEKSLDEDRSVISTMTRLVHLEIPEYSDDDVSLSDLVNLRVLRIGSLEMAPPTNLEHLHIEREFYGLHSLPNLIHLVHLRVSLRDHPSWPSEIYELTNLEELEIANMNLQAAKDMDAPRVPGRIKIETLLGDPVDYLTQTSMDQRDDTLRAIQESINLRAREDLRDGLNGI